jgi:hypothetical protein
MNAAARGRTIRTSVNSLGCVSTSIAPPYYRQLLVALPLCAIYVNATEPA